MLDPLINLPKLIINAALTGIVPSKEQNPNVPVSPTEMIADARRCRDAGASIVHVHARDAQGKPAWQTEIYHEIVEGIRSKCPDLIVCVTTTGRVFQRLEERAASMGANPDMASLTCGSLNFPSQASVNQPSVINELAVLMRDHKPQRIVPELEFFDFGMIAYAKYMISKGFLVAPFYCNILLGNLGTLHAEPHHLINMVRELPTGTIWSATGIGRYQSFVQNLAIAMGGHVRAGLEDNLFYDVEKQQPATNPGLVERVVKVADSLGRKIASTADARAAILPGRKI